MSGNIFVNAIENILFTIFFYIFSSSKHIYNKKWEKILDKKKKETGDWWLALKTGDVSGVVVVGW